MKRYLNFLLIITFGLISNQLQAQTIGQETIFERRLNNRDDLPLRQFVESKENIDVKTKANNLDISGDVRFEWTSLQEKGEFLYAGTDDYYYDGNCYCCPYLSKSYRPVRGGSRIILDRLTASTNDFDVEFNLKFKYSFEKAWAMAHLDFDNEAGIGVFPFCNINEVILNSSGSSVEIDNARRCTRRGLKGSGLASAISLKRAYIGYNIYADGANRLDIEFGRRKLNDIFMSEIQFTNRFDGILLKFASAIEEVGDWYFNAGAFVIDERKNHYGCAGEVGLVNIYDTGLELRYSIIDWRKTGINRCKWRNPIGADFLNSQWSIEYRIAPTICGEEVSLDFYAGFVINHAARKNKFTRHMKKNLGWYAGLMINEVAKKGDWSFDFEYIYVQAQAVADSDVGSIGRGNIYNYNLFDVVQVPVGSETAKVLPRLGNANLKGARVNFIYAITDNLSVDTVYQYSIAEDKRIGGDHYYSAFTIEMVYAF